MGPGQQEVVSLSLAIGRIIPEPESLFTDSKWNWNFNDVTDVLEWKSYKT